MKKRIWSIALALGQCLSLLPAVALAEGHIGTYPLWISDTQVTNENKADVLNGGTVSFNPAIDTLTLNNVTITVEAVSRNRIGIDWKEKRQTNR